MDAHVLMCVCRYVCTYKQIYNNNHEISHYSSSF